jgi:putative transposase
MVAAVEHRFGRVDRLPGPVEWLTDNGGCYLARETRPSPGMSAWCRARHPW